MIRDRRMDGECLLDTIDQAVEQLAADLAEGVDRRAAERAAAAKIRPKLILFGALHAPLREWC